MSLEAGYVDDSELFKKYVLRFLNRHNYDAKQKKFDPKRFRYWFQSLFDKTRENDDVTLTEELKTKFPEIEHVSINQSGPSRTLRIQAFPTRTIIDIDIAPVLTFPTSRIKDFANLSKKLINFDRDNKFFLVPKDTPKNEKLKKVINPKWRLDFHDDETKLIKDKKFAKPIIRHLKAFKMGNHEVINNISSYVLKTVVMKMLEESPNPSDWSEPSKVFIEALKLLGKYLSDGKVPYIHDSQCNILWKRKEYGDQYRQIGKWICKSVVHTLEQSLNSGNSYEEIQEIWTTQFRLGEAKFNEFNRLNTRNMTFTEELNEVLGY